MASNSNVKSQIARILNIEESSAWEIVDSIPAENLYLVHYKQDANMSQFGSIRGVVVDVAARVVVCRSFGYTPSITTEFLTPDQTNTYNLIDENGRAITVDGSDVSFKLGFEGTIVRVFKHNGNVYHSSHRRLDISRSRWGSTRTFDEIYKDLDGPSDDVLFDPETKYSPYCHVFLMVAPDVLVATKQKIGKGYMVYLGPRVMWSTQYDECPYKQTKKDGELYVSQTQFEEDPRPDAGWIDDTLLVPKTISQFPENITEPFLYLPQNLSLDLANQYLKYGYYEPYESGDFDVRLTPGESIMLYVKTPTGESLYKVQGPSYAWRTSMRNNDPNLYHQFFILTNGMYITDYSEYEKRFPIFNREYPVFSPNNVAELRRVIDQEPITVWNNETNTIGDTRLIRTRDNRLTNLWIAMLMAVPIHRQHEVVNYLDNYQMERNGVIGWLLQINNNSDPTMEVPTRARQIINVARQGASKRIDRGETTMTFQEIVRDNIIGFIMKEEGSSLYRLVRAMKQSKETPVSYTEQNPLTIRDFIRE
jgi:hypothetical protein